MFRGGVCGGGGACCWVGTGPLGAPSTKASGDRGGPALPHVGVGGRGSGLLTPGVSDLCGSELSPENCKTLNKSLLTSHARGGERTLTASVVFISQMKKLRPRERKVLMKVFEAEVQSRFRGFYDSPFPLSAGLQD